MVRRAIAMTLIGLLTTTGCTVSFNGDNDPSDKGDAARDGADR